MRAKESKIARRGLPSIRRFFRALTAAPLRLAGSFWFARMVLGEPQGGCHAARFNS